MANKKSRPVKQIQVAADPEQENAGMAQILQDGANTEFWQIICKALDESMDVGLVNLSQDISDLPAPEYKVVNEINKAKVKFLAVLKDLPNSYAEFLIKKEVNTDGSLKSFDPYLDPEEL